jgi:predicted NBD/HSP70 family sugar kinase
MTALCRQSMDLGFTDNFDEIVFLATREPLIENMLIRAGLLLAQALLGAVNLFDVDTVVIGGHHFQQVSTWFLPPVEAAMSDLTMRREVRPVNVKYSTLGEAAGAVGAASVVFDKLLPVSPPLVATLAHSREAANVKR